MSNTVSIYQNNCMFTASNGRVYQGNRWIIRMDGEVITTKKTKKAAIDSVRSNLGDEVVIVWGMQ